MSKVAMSGADGFLGFHSKAALLETQTATEAVPVGTFFDLESATAAISGSDRFVHLAGINRASDDEVLEGNTLFAKQAAAALEQAAVPPPVVAYANSIQAQNDSVYGHAKAAAAEILRAASQKVGATFVDVQLPNLFGEHGRPFYNAVTATFCHLLANGQQPSIQEDKELTLLHAQNAADVLLGNVPLERIGSLVAKETVSGLLTRLKNLHDVYLKGDIPDIAGNFDRDLFNTYRSYVVHQQTPISLSRHEDPRGSFFEVIRSHGGPGQSSFSTTVPGVTRGDHFHRRKIERFAVLSGQARISLRKLFTDEIIHVEVSSDSPVAVDMPTMWTHNITNSGNEVLYTSFWTNELFDPANPDTIPEAV